MMKPRTIEQRVDAYQRRRHRGLGYVCGNADATYRFLLREAYRPEWLALVAELPEQKDEDTLVKLARAHLKAKRDRLMVADLRAAGYDAR
jgi:hypothetical protein